MSKQIISTPDAPAAIGTYSQAVRVGNTIWVSGQIPLDPATKELVKGDIEAQIRQVFENLKAIVVAAGATFDDVVKATVFLIDLTHFGLVNKVMAEYFREPYPARAAVGMAALPRGARCAQSLLRGSAPRPQGSGNRASGISAHRSECTACAGGASHPDLSSDRGCDAGTLASVDPYGARPDGGRRHRGLVAACGFGGFAPAFLTRRVAVCASPAGGCSRRSIV